MRAARASILKTDAEIDDSAGDWPVNRRANGAGIGLDQTPGS